MFERYESVLDRVSVVAKRYRAICFWWAFTILCFVAIVAGGLLIQAAQTGRVQPDRATWILLGLVSTLTLVIAIGVRRAFRDPRWIAQKIELRYPSLQQRLVTAVGLLTTPERQEFGFLQRRVISDAYHHSVTHRWVDTAPRWASALGRFTGSLSFVAFGIVAATLLNTSPQQADQNAALPLALRQIVIEPGNTEVEAGNGLVISARYPSLKDMPTALDLVITAADGSERRLAMSQSLEDPLLSVFVPSIDKSFKYQVAATNWRSESYDVEVFRFPDLVRADVTLDYPDYTKLETRKVGDATRVSAVEGTQLQWQLQFNHSLACVIARNKAGQQVELAFSDEQASQATLQALLLQTERWTLELSDARGRTNKYPITLDARAIPNRPPDLKMTSGGDKVVSPLEEWSPAATVVDDFGLARAGIGYALGGDEPVEITLSESAAKGAKVSLNHLIEMETLNAQPDQLLSYYFWAEDIGADGSVRRLQGDLYFAEVRPFDEIFREGDSPSGQSAEQPPGQGSGQQAEQLADLQKQIIAATWKLLRQGEPADESLEFSENLKVIQESQQQALTQANELVQAASDSKSKQLGATLTEQMQEALQQLREAGARATSKPLQAAVAAEQAAYQTLLQLRAHEFQVSRSRQRSSSSSRSASAQQRQQQINELELKNDENRYETNSQATDPEAENAQREERQILNRLKELAQRQEDINEQLSQLQSALEKAETEAEKEELRRQLKRLREQEQELLRETDELADRMQQQPSQENEDLKEQLEETRENIRASGEALEQSDAQVALSTGKRAERQLQEIGDEFRRRTAQQFDEAVREMRTKAREIEKQQTEIGEQLKQLSSKEQPGLRTATDRQSLEAAIEQQRTAADELLKQVQDTVEEAEVAEPLLAQQLYETYRQTQQKQLDQRLQELNELVKRGFDNQLQPLQDDAAQTTTDLRTALEQAADAVLGSEEKALQRALQELESLDQSLQEEIAAANGQGAAANADKRDMVNRDANNRDANNPAENREGENPDAASREAGSEATAIQTPGSSRDSAAGERNSPNQSQAESERTPEQASRSQSAAGETPRDPQAGEPQEGRPTGAAAGSESPDGQPAESATEPAQEGPRQGGGSRREGSQAGNRLEQLAESTGSRPGFSSPIAGGGFREWTDGLREVEEMVGDPELRSRAATIRDRARQMRIEMTRHAQAPQWDLVESMIAEPLRELKAEVADALLRRTADRAAPVPIDRDPVPDEYSRAVQRYYENLGGGR